MRKALGKIRKHGRTVLAVCVVLASLGGCEKYSLDRRMEQLCAKDAGVRVYESVALPKEMFSPSGLPFPPRLRTARPGVNTDTESTVEEALGTEYRRVWRTTYLKRGDPVRGDGLLVRHTEQISRLSDGKILGESVSYGRSGGDFIAYPHFSSKLCPTEQNSNAVVQAVFAQKK